MSVLRAFAQWIMRLFGIETSPTRAMEREFMKAPGD